MSGCIEKKGTNSFNSINSRDYIVYSIKNMPDDLYMLNTRDSSQKELLLLLFDNLVEEDSDGNILPELAESYTVSKDNLIYTFKIKEDIFWSDGISITAHDFVDFFNRILSKEFSNPRKNELSCILGVNDFIEGKKGFDSVGIEAPDAKTLVIKLAVPCSYFLNILAMPEYSLRRVNDQTNNTNDSLLTWQTNFKQLVYSGPFQIENITKNGEITLIKNDYYLHKDEIKAPKIVIKGNTNRETALADFDTGKTDLFLNPPINECSRLLSNNSAEDTKISYTTYLCFNLKNSEAAKNLKFRNAINYSIDRNELLKNCDDKIATSANSFIDNGSKVFNENSDISKAKDILKELDLNNTKINIICSDDSYGKSIIEALVKKIRSDLKINIVLNEYEDKQYEDALQQGQYDIAVVDYHSALKAPEYSLKSWSSENWLNYSGYSNAEYDNNLTKESIEKDKTKKQQYLTNCQNILLKDLPVIPLYSDNLILCKSKNIDGLSFTNQGNLDLRFAYINKIKETTGFKPVAPSGNTYRDI